MKLWAWGFVFLFVVFNSTKSLSQNCEMLFTGQNSSRELRNAVLRLTNVHEGMDAHVVRLKSNDRRVVMIFEDSQHRPTLDQHVKEEVAELRAEILAARSLNGEMGPMLLDALKDPTKDLWNKATTDTDVSKYSPKQVKVAQAVRKDEVRLVKVLAAMGVALPSAIGTAILFAVDAPMKEFIIPTALFASYMAYRQFSKAIENKYAGKYLDIQRENDLQEVRDVNVIYPYDMLRNLALYLQEKEDGPLLVLLLPESLKAPITEALKENNLFEDVEP